MRKDELNTDGYCPDCVEADESNAGPDNNDSEECSCCCSCSDCTSEAESNDTPSASLPNRGVSTLEEQKKDLLASLNILQTNREQASIQNILQFIEALSHSPDFLRRYNLQENFCMECLLSEPICTCCTTEISHLNMQDQSSDSCDECNATGDSRNQAYSFHERADCASSSKAQVSGRQRNRNRGERRQRRRQRNIRHTLPRASLSRNTQQQNSNGRVYCRRDNSQSERHLVEGLHNHDECKECDRRSSRNVSQLEQNRGDTFHNEDDCEECVREVTPRHSSRTGRPETISGDRNNDSESCQECDRRNLPSTSCAFSCCEECESKIRMFGIHSRQSSNGKDNCPECSCTCCNNPVNEDDASQRSVDKTRKQKVSDRPECDQSETCSECSERCRNQSGPGECSCGESGCSDESCDECRSERSGRNKKK